MAGISTFWYWLAGGVVLVTLEMVIPGVFLLWIGLAAIVTGAIAFVLPALGLELQGLAFAVLAIVSVLVGRVVYGSGDDETSDHPSLNRRERTYVGHVYPLVGAMTDGRGRVRIGDTVWSVESSDAGLDLDAGVSVRVLGARGTVLLVEPEDAAET